MVAERGEGTASIRTSRHFRAGNPPCFPCFPCFPFLASLASLSLLPLLGFQFPRREGEVVQPSFPPRQPSMGTEAVESSDDRRARLRALRAAQELSAQEPTTIAPPSTNGNSQHQGPDHAQHPEDQDEAEKTDAEMKFRNYFPRDTDLQKAKHPPPVIPKFEDPVATDPLQVTGAEDPIVSIAPKKPNWDLRRDVAKKLEKLEKRTQRAIVELMNEEEKRRQAEAADNMEQD